MAYTFNQTEKDFLNSRLVAGQHQEAYSFIANRLIADDEFVTGEGFVVGTSPADRDPEVIRLHFGLQVRHKSMQVRGCFLNLFAHLPTVKVN